MSPTTTMLSYVHGISKCWWLSLVIRSTWRAWGKSSWSEVLAATWRKTIYRVDGPLRKREEGILHRGNRVCKGWASFFILQYRVFTGLHSGGGGEVTYPRSYHCLAARVGIKASSPCTASFSSGVNTRLSLTHWASWMGCHLTNCPPNQCSQQIISVILDFKLHILDKPSLYSGKLQELQS